ncbi:hypothetical protein [Microbulbifer sp. ALW1]|uniref:hypothetical protein n=1 Tax=Microbulbifer sp. (strain ALW1) TaxID=1516059 RepID=UPI0013573321|nr:hypothetical protein [Microbulbifer sp. ALW1]
MTNASVEKGDLAPPPGKGRPGLKPGQTTSTSFKPGFDSRRNLNGCYGKSGRDAAQTAMKIARKHSIEHIQTLNAIAKDSSEPAAARIAAIRELGAIGGLQKAIERSEAATEAENPQELSREALLRILNEELAERTIEGELAELSSAE